MEMDTQKADKPMDFRQINISANNFEDCIKCTICTVYCPVTPVNPDYPGPKQAGPDGERYRLKKPWYYDEGLKYCLNCKRCEVVCPSNVRIGDIIQAARIKYSSHGPSLRDRMLASTDFVGTMAGTFAPVVNPMLHLKPVKMVLDKVMKIDRHRTFPDYSATRFTTWYNRNVRDIQDAMPNGHVSYFHGCYVQYNFPQLGKDLIKVMNAIGYGVHLLDRERCCGVAKIANKLIREARRDAAINMKSIRASVERDNRTVLTTSSTCTLTMRDEYPHLLDVAVSDVRRHIMLATRFIYHLVDEGKVKLVFRSDYKKRVAYHSPCHMDKLGWAIYSTSLLRMIPGLEFVPLDSVCCGIAGTYGFKKENYEYSQAIGAPLFEQITHSNLDIVATDCETCKWQIEMSTPVPVQNPISVIADALDVEATRKANGM